jgi:hypothetical protein
MSGQNFLWILGRNKLKYFKEKSFELGFAILKPGLHFHPSIYLPSVCACKAQLFWPFLITLIVFNGLTNLEFYSDAENLS